MKTYSYTPLLITFISTLSLCVSVVPPTGHWIINLTNSQPKGIYHIQKLQNYERGDLVLFHLKTKDEYLVKKPWLNGKRRLLKEVAALNGDTFCVGDNRIRLRDKDYGEVFEKDYLGEKLPQIVGCKTLANSEFLPLSNKSKRSFDGRYIGAQDLEQIQGQAELVLEF